jgi:hypothetical protein
MPRLDPLFALFALLALPQLLLARQCVQLVVQGPRLGLEQLLAQNVRSGHMLFRLLPVVCVLREATPLLQEQAHVNLANLAHFQV